MKWCYSSVSHERLFYKYWFQKHVIKIMRIYCDSILVLLHLVHYSCYTVLLFRAFI